MSTETGLRAEAAVAECLKNAGYKILAQNWRTRFCEIDIVASRKGRVHFVEVKYRQSEAFGTGFDYITASKIGRLKRAAHTWMAEHDDSDYQIDIAAVSGTVELKVELLPNAIEAD